MINIIFILLNFLANACPRIIAELGENLANFERKRVPELIWFYFTWAIILPVDSYTQELITWICLKEN